MFMTYEWVEIPRNSCLVYGCIFLGPGSPNLRFLMCGPQRAHGAATAQHGPQNSAWPMPVIYSLSHSTQAPPSTCPQPVREPLGKEAHLVSKMKVEFSSVTQGFYSFQSLLSSDGRACFGNKKAWLAQTSPLWFDNLFWRVNHIWYKSTLHPFPALLDCNIPPFNQLIYVFRQVCEGFLHINGISGWRFNVLHAVCSSQFLCLMASHLPLCIQVTLVTHQNKYNLVGLNVYFGLF